MVEERERRSVDVEKKKKKKNRGNIFSIMDTAISARKRKRRGRSYVIRTHLK